MPRSTRKVLLVPILAAAALLGSGCSSTVQGTPAPTGGSPAATDGDGGSAPVGTNDPVAWADQVCGVLVAFSKGPGGQPPEVDPSSPEKAIEGFTAYLDKAIDTTDTAIAGLGAVGPSPVAGGDEFVQKMNTNLSTVKDFFQTTRTGFENFDPADPESLSDALGGGLAPPQGLEDLEDPGEALKASPELAAAAEQAPKCQELERS